MSTPAGTVLGQYVATVGIDGSVESTGAVPVGLDFQRAFSTQMLALPLPLLRKVKPNSPPIGASIEVYAYVWVMVAAVVAAMLVILAGAPRPEPPQPPAAPARQNALHGT